MRHQLTRAEAERGRRASKRRQREHDAECRPALVRASKSGRPTIAMGRRFLEDAGVTPPLGGGRWHVAQVHRIAKRLGIKLGRGLRPGVLLYCRKCGKGKRKLKESGLCRWCQAAANRAREHRGIRKAELADAREKAAFYAAKVERLESGVRHYPGQRRKHFTAR